MKQIMLCCLLIASNVFGAQAQIRVGYIKGNVQVRHGVQANWENVMKGSILKPEDSIRLLKKSAATLILDDQSKFMIPEFSIVDIADLRQLSEHDLLLKLAMNDVKSVQQKRPSDLTVPKTSTVHGENKDGGEQSAEIKRQMMSLMLNGTKALYDHGFFATCILKAKEVYRLDPDLLMNINARFIVASAFERMTLKAEALREYQSIVHEQLNKQQRLFIERKINDLQQKNKQ